MTAFFRKPIAGIAPLGERLRSIREKKRLTIDEVARQTRISPKYLEAIEVGAYRRLPGEVYARNFLRTYATALDVNEERVFALYEQERAVIAPRPHQAPPNVVKEARGIPYGKLARRLLLFLALPALALYLVVKVQSIVTPPPLVLSSPSADLTTTDTSVLVAGTTSTESVVKINGQQVFHDTGGAFSERVELQPGLNVITVSATKERSKPVTVERRILVQTGPTAVQ